MALTTTTNDKESIYNMRMRQLPKVLLDKVFLFVGPTQGMPTSQEISCAVEARQERIDFRDMPDLLEPMTFGDVHSALSIAIDSGLTIEELMEDPTFEDAVERMDGLTSDNVIYLSQLLDWGTAGINLEEIFDAEEDPSLIGEIDWTAVDALEAEFEIDPVEAE
jgi:hypothetical protein